MATIADTREAVNTLTFDQALLQAVARAKAAFPAEKCRIERALAIAMTGEVIFFKDGSAYVPSQSHTGGGYHVNGRCTCPDAPHAPGGRCKHRWAKALVKDAQRCCARQPKPERYWATYYPPHSEAMHGVAEWQAAKQCWLFIPEGGENPLYPAIQALALGGHIETEQAQREKDGDLVAKVCGY